MTLSRDLGIPIGPLQDMITASEFVEYRVHYKMDPSPDIKSQYGFASVCTTIANANRGKKATPFKIKDFLLQFKHEKGSLAPTAGNKNANRDRVTSKLKAWLTGMKLLGAPAPKGKS